MSKKMMRRSLALGALMAFVITGQALAADVTINYPDGHEFGIANEYNAAVKNDNYTVDGNLSVTTTHSAIYMQGNEKNMSVTADTITLKSDNDTVVLATYTSDGSKNHLSVTATEGDLTITGGKAHGVAAANVEGSVTLNAAGKVTVTAGENAVYARHEGAEVSINAANVEIESTNVEGNGDTKGHAIVTNAKDASVTVKATNNLTLTAVEGKKAVNATGKDSLVTLNAQNSIDITGVVHGDSLNNARVKIGDETTGNITITSSQGKGEYASTEGVVRNVDIVSNGIVKIEGTGNLSGVGAGANDAMRAQTTNSIKAEEIEIVSEGGYGIYVNDHGYHTVGTRIHADLEAENISIDSYKSGIHVMNGGVAEITGFVNLNVIAGDRGISGEFGNITVTGGNVVVESGEEGIQSILGGEMKFETEFFKVDSGLEAIKLTGKSNLNLDSDITQITGDVLLESDSEYGDPNLIVAFNGKDSALTGKVTTNGGESNLTFNAGAWNLKGASTVSDVTFASGSVLNLVDGNAYKAAIDESTGEAIKGEGAGIYAITAAGTETGLTVDGGAKLQITDIEETTYNIAAGFADYKNVAEKIDIADNALLEAKKVITENYYQVEVKAKDASDMAADTGMSESTADLVTGIIKGDKGENNTPAQQAAVDFITNANNNATPEAVGAAINAATKMGEAGGNSATAASIVKNVTGVTNDRLSFNCGHSAPHKGGHGVGLFEEGSGADIWVEYVHGKDEVEDMPSTAGKTSYEGQYNGIVMGVDFKKVNKFQSGIAFNYGEGDTNSLGSSVRTHSDYDFWGVGYYGNIHNDDSNVIFDINYAKTDSDVTQYNSGSTLEASPETTTWSAGVKLEKLYQNENVQIVPYTGLRYMSIDADDYSTKKGEFYYSMDRQDIWLLPLGVSIRQEVANDNGWTVSPRVDLSYIWAFGDTNSNMEVKSPFPGVSQIGYDVMDDGSFLGLVGIEAHKGQWGYGVAYSYQKGDHSESKKWYVDVNYSF